MIKQDQNINKKLSKYIDRILVGFEFEFYIKDSKYLSEFISEIEQKLGRSVYTSRSKADKTKDFILTRDLSGGYFMYELITPPFDWWTSISYLKFIFGQIDKYGYTTDKSGLHVNMSINNASNNSGYDNEHIIVNPLFLSINLDLNTIKSIFPFSEGYQKVYKRPILAFHIHPLFFNESMLNSDFVMNKLDIHTHIVFPEMKYYEFNTKKAMNGIYEFRHIGGKDYHKKFEYILELIYYYLAVLVFTYEQGITDKDLQKLIGILKSQYQLKQKLNDPNKIANMDNIHFTVDTIPEPNYTYGFISKWFEPLFNIIMRRTNTDVIYVNYDSEQDRIEIYNSDVINNMVIGDALFMNCNLDGIYEKNIMISCDINHSIINGCDVLDCKINESKLSNCVIKKSNIYNSLITTRHKIIKDCDIKSCIISIKAPLLMKNNITKSHIIYRDQKPK